MALGPHIGFWMNEWVGPDVNVVGPLQMPPSDGFSLPEGSHFFGK